MKCLSVSQPFAELIIQGKKTIELRTWNTKFRGEFLVHAPLKVRTMECKRLGINEKSLAVGAIIGRVELYDVKIYHNMMELNSDYRRHLAGRNYSHCKYGFMLRNPKKLLQPLSYKGRLGFFEAKLYCNIKDEDIKSELFYEEYRYQWIGKH